MKIEVNCEEFQLCGNTYKKGDIVDIDDPTGSMLIERYGCLVNADIVVALPPTKKPDKKVESNTEDKTLDLNEDGTFDEKDKSIAAKVLATNVPKKCVIQKIADKIIGKRGKKR